MPNISYVSPQTLTSGDIATITGTGFGASGMVYINGYETSYDSWADNKIILTIPSRFIDQSMSFIVKTEVGYSNSVVVNIAAVGNNPIINRIDPIEPDEDSYIAIYGQGFGNDTGAVYIGGRPAQLVTWMDTRIECLLPNSISEYAEVIVQQFTLKSSAYLLWIKMYPVINGILNPVAGQEMTINGVNFRAQMGKIYVNDIELTPTYWSDSSIRINLPSVARGQATVKVTTLSGVTSEYYNFQIHSSPEIISHEPVKVLQGREFTLIGNGFLDHGNVTINGVPLMVLEWIPPDRVRVVPPANFTGTQQVIVECDGLVSLPHSLVISPNPEIRSTSPIKPIQRQVTTVFGVNFGESGTIFINNTPVATEYWSDTEISLFIPSTVIGTIKFKVLTSGEFSNEFIADVITVEEEAPTYHIWNEPLGIITYHMMIEEDEQFQVTIGVPYKVGTNELAVYVNGSRQSPITEATPWGAYAETNPTTIEFDEPLIKGDILILEIRRFS